MTEWFFFSPSPSTTAPRNSRAPWNNVRGGEKNPPISLNWSKKMITLHCWVRNVLLPQLWPHLNRTSIHTKRQYCHHFAKLSHFITFFLIDVPLDLSKKRKQNIVLQFSPFFCLLFSLERQKNAPSEARGRSAAAGTVENLAMFRKLLTLQWKESESKLTEPSADTIHTRTAGLFPVGGACCARPNQWFWNRGSKKLLTLPLFMTRLWPVCAALTASPGSLAPVHCTDTQHPHFHLDWLGILLSQFKSLSFK